MRTTEAGLPASVLADLWSHHNAGSGRWILMTIAMVVFWGAMLALAVWAVRGGTFKGSAMPEEILRTRLADGSISVEEYEQRHAALTTKIDGPSADVVSESKRPNDGSPS